MRPRKIPMKGARIHSQDNLQDQRTRDLCTRNDPENEEAIQVELTRATNETPWGDEHLSAS